MKSSKILLPIIGVLFLIFEGKLSAIPSHLQYNVDSTFFESFLRDSLLNMTLELDFKHIKNRKLDTYKSGTLSLADRNGQLQQLKVEVKPRGNMRRRICDFPPLRIRFSKEEVSARGFKDYRKLELTTVCDKGESYEQYILREYVIYKLYNLLTPYSFRVQLAKVNFVDTGSKSKSFESYAILLESTDEMIDRLHGRELPKRYVSSSILNNDACELFSIFQFMIGNTDWYVHNQHNVKIIGIKNTADAVPVAYDFDYAGFVNAPYAVPQDELKIRHVTERYYQGYCRSEEETMQTIRLFLDKKAEILGYCELFIYFDERSKKQVRNYLEEFFGIIENPKAIKSELLKHCNQWLGREK